MHTVLCARPSCVWVQLIARAQVRGLQHLAGPQLCRIVGVDLGRLDPIWPPQDLIQRRLDHWQGLDGGWRLVRAREVEPQRARARLPPTAWGQAAAAAAATTAAAATAAALLLARCTSAGRSAGVARRLVPAADAARRLARAAAVPVAVALIRRLCARLARAAATCGCLLLASSGADGHGLAPL